MFAGGSKVNQWLQEWSGQEIDNKAIVVSTCVKCHNRSTSDLTAIDQTDVLYSVDAPH
jgi:hypothetical protein